MRWMEACLVAALAGCGGGAAGSSFDAGADGSELCTDGDGDTIHDGDEGRAASTDTDGDGAPDFDDFDSDGDGLFDALEAGDSDPCTAPRDNDADGTHDFRDFDSDNDGLADLREDVDGDARIDAGETSHLRADTDGDACSDLQEWAADTDPRDSTQCDLMSPMVFLPYGAAAQTMAFHAKTALEKIDIVFDIDGSVTNDAVMDEFDTEGVGLIADLAALAPDVAFGLSTFRDFPLSPFGVAGDLPFERHERVTTDSDAIAEALVQLNAQSGGDASSSGYEALFQLLAGGGVTWDGGSIPKFNPIDGFDELQGHGMLGGMGFRDGALPIVLHVTPFEHHDANTYWDEGITEAHSYDEVIQAALVAGAPIISFGHDADNMMTGLATDTGAMVAIEAWGGWCETGFSDEPTPEGLCPLAYDLYAWNLSDHMVDAVSAFLEWGEISISARTLADAEFPGVPSELLVASVTPVAPAPPGTSIAGDAFLGVTPGPAVPFEVALRNADIPHALDPKRLEVRVVALANGVARVDSVELILVVPGGAPP